ncbi:hypothetical protein DWX17_09060 [[Clostridium] innocuum]|nr:hypothetical protein DWX17_09060 [[Clostridium] innocuum]
MIHPSFIVDKRRVCYDIFIRMIREKDGIFLCLPYQKAKNSMHFTRDHGVIIYYIYIDSRKKEENHVAITRIHRK